LYRDSLSSFDARVLDGIGIVRAWPLLQSVPTDANPTTILRMYTSHAQPLWPPKIRGAHERTYVRPPFPTAKFPTDELFHVIPEKVDGTIQKFVLSEVPLKFPISFE
jgi:hypothetical protein